MRSLGLIVALLLATPTPVRADAAAKQRAARALFDAQVKALAEGKLDAFVGAFVDSDSAGAMFPSSRFVATGRQGIRNEVTDWAGTGRLATAVKVIGTPLVSVKPDRDTSKRSSRLAVVTGDLEVTLKGKPKLALRMTEVYSDGLDKTREGALVVVAAFLSEATEDKNLRGQDLVAENTSFDRFLDLLRAPDVLATHFDAGPDDLVIGSSARDKAQGAAAKKLLATWASLKFVVISKPQIVGELDWVYVLGSVSLSRGKTQKPAPLNVLLVGYAECLGNPCAGKDLVAHAVALHYGQPR